MSSLLQGFRSGFDMMDRHFRNQESDRRFSEQMALQRQQAERAGQQHEASMQSHALNTQLLQEQVNDLPVQREHRDSVRALELDTAQQQNEVSKFNLSSAKDRKRQSDAKERLGMYAASGDWAGFLTDKSFQNTNAGLLQSVEGADSAIALSDSISNNDLPGIIQHANALFKSKLNRNVGKMKGRNGATIRDISIINMEQAEGGKTKLRVRVTTDNGPYESYISEMRGIDPNDPDKQFTADELLGTAAVMGNLAHTLKSSGVYDRLAQGADRALGVSASKKGSAIPAEVNTIAMLSQMTGISAEELVRAKYLSQKDPSGATLRKTALELAQKDPRWANLEDYANDPAKQQQMASSIISEYSGYLMQGDAAPAASNQPQPGAPTNTNELGDDPLGIRR